VQPKQFNWRAVAIFAIVLTVAVGACCGLRQLIFKEDTEAGSIIRFKQSGVPVQQISDWSIY
jgi:hypothetical protein